MTPTRPGWRLFLALHLALIGVVWPTVPVHAEAWQWGGHVKYQLSHGRYARDDVATRFGEREPTDHDLDLRAKAERRAGPWEWVAHYELLAVAGDSLETRRALAPFLSLTEDGVLGLPDDRRRALDLTHVLSDNDRRAAVHRLDRLSLAYVGTQTSIRIGRQAVSWGNGLVFQPMDFVNPFSPVAIDKEYKTGDDMVYAQWTRARGDDLQAIALPRRDPQDRDLESRQSTYALKYHGRMASVDVDMLSARHVGETLVGVGAASSLGGAVARADLLVTKLDRGDWVGGGVINVDYSWTLAGRNLYGYVEYYRNAVGERDESRYTALPDNPDLRERLRRGEVFVLGRDYLALGLRIELSPLVNLFQNLISNLHDGSGFYQLRVSHDLRQDSQLLFGLNWPYGRRGSEFGGLELGPLGISAPARTAYLRYAFYF